MTDKNLKFDLNDLLIVPSVQTGIDSRSQVFPYYENNMLPLFAAPMDTVISTKNYMDFISNKIHVCTPRVKKTNDSSISEFNEFQQKYNTNHLFVSESLSDFKKIFIDYYKFFLEDFAENPDLKLHVLIDIANGHMSSLRDTIYEAKDLFGSNIVLMVGNIANSKTYRELSVAGADYIRVGIGAGAGCLTSVQTAVGYPMASLIRECYESSKSLVNPAKIVADGGMKSYSDIIKSLALGADYVMIGSLLNKTLESSGQPYFNGIKINDKVAKYLFSKGFNIDKKFRGMSTKEVQKEWGKTILTTSEGIVKKQRVEYMLESWTENFTDYLKSTMSYCNARNLGEFIGKANTVLISEESRKRFSK